MRRKFHRCVVSAFISIGLVMLASAHVFAGTTGGIQGFVTDEAGHPIAGAAVAAAAPSGHATTITGPNGFYAVNGLPLDTYTVTFSKDGFLTLSIAGRDYRAGPDQARECSALDDKRQIVGTRHRAELGFIGPANGHGRHLRHQSTAPVRSQRNAARSQRLCSVQLPAGCHDRQLWLSGDQGGCRKRRGLRTRWCR